MRYIEGAATEVMPTEEQREDAEREAHPPCIECGADSCADFAACPTCVEGFQLNDHGVCPDCAVRS